MGETKDAKRITSPVLPVEGGRPLPACQVMVVYPLDDPYMPQVALSKGCSDADAALAVSIVLTALLKAVAEGRQ